MLSGAENGWLAFNDARILSCYRPEPLRSGFKILLREWILISHLKYLAQVSLYSSSDSSKFTANGPGYSNIWFNVRRNHWIRHVKARGPTQCLVSSESEMIVP